jgi:hypothetical protein
MSLIANYLRSACTFAIHWHSDCPSKEGKSSGQEQKTFVCNWELQMQSKVEDSQGFTMELSCQHAAIHIVNDVATCIYCGQTLGSIDKQEEQTETEILTIQKEAATWCLLSH